MKTLLPIKVVTAFLLLTSLQSFSQITITTDNMPHAGDTIRISETNTSGIADPAQTGFDYTWDYSNLEPSSQRVLEFINPTQTPFLYQIVFNSNVTNLASPIETLDFIEFDVTDAYEYFKNNSFQFGRAGYAMTISSIPVPLKYDTPEILYKFPLSVTSDPDSSVSEIEIQYPGIGYFTHLRKRVNSIDGSGTLTTPYGTFNTIRQKSIIYERDSTFIDSLQTGFPIVRNIIEYKWLSPDYPVPLLVIATEGFFYSIQYIDSLREIIPLAVDLGDDTTICQGESVNLTADVKGGEPPYSYLWSTGDTLQSIQVSPNDTTNYSVLIVDNNQNFVYDEIIVNVVPFELIKLGDDTTICAQRAYTYTVTGNYDKITWYVNGNQIGTGTLITIDTTGIGTGIFVVSVEYQQGSCIGTDEILLTFEVCNSLPESMANTLLIKPNPATNKVSIENGIWKNPLIRLFSMGGAEMQNFRYLNENSRILIDISQLDKGVYTIVISEDGIRKTGKLVVR
ncbi:MAG TPA: T9SS type A sorting domain-containing protein [Lentimicrobium sp.]|nr:T9SS type A sorting domain-containing protein [Lentimicrobium sp.]